jgi:hypothetical protein
MLKQKSVDHIEKSSLDLVETIKESYNNFLNEFYSLSKNIPNKESIELWFNKTCNDIDPLLKNLELEFKLQKSLFSKRNYSETELLRTFQTITLLYGKIDTLLYVGTRETNNLKI